MSPGDTSENTAIRVTGLTFAALGLCASILFLIFGGAHLDEVGGGRRLERLGLPNWVVATGITVVCAAAIVAIAITWVRARRAAARDGAPLSAPHADFDDASIAAELPPAKPGEWTRLGRTDWWHVTLLTAPLWLAVFVTVRFVVELTRIVTEDWAPTVAVGVVSLGLSVAVAVVITRRRYPAVWVDIAERRLRSAGRELRWDEVSAAELVVGATGSKRTRTLFLVLRGDDGLRVLITLVRRGAPAIQGREAAVARAIIASSSIAMPRAKEDPEGRFSRYNFPTNLSKEDAEAVVARPPRAGDPLPIPY